MNINRFRHHLRALVAASLALLASATLAPAQGYLVSQPNVDTGLPVALWTWQSFTLAEDSDLTLIEVEWNGSPQDEIVYEATLDVLTGEGLAGALLATVTGTVVLYSSGPYDGYSFLTGDFTGVRLVAGQYTLSIHDPTSELQLVGTENNSYNEGKNVNDAFGDIGMDLTFFISGTVVPEPSPLALTLLALTTLGGFNYLRRRK